jgi:uncharacterized protein
MKIQSTDKRSTRETGGHSISEQGVLKKKSWSPYTVGVLIGVLSWFAFFSVDKPIGITTAFEYTSALFERAVAPEKMAGSAYFQNPEKNPKIDWEWMLVLGVFIGGYISSRLSGDRPVGEEKSVPHLWRWRFGASKTKRYFGAFVGGAAMMFGARLAQGCTSGHGISGTLQLACQVGFLSRLFSQ